MSDEFERTITTYPPFDKRHDDPNKNYGVGALILRFVLKGKLGATQFVMSTGAYPANVTEEWQKRKFTGHNMCKPMAYDLGCHGPIPQYEGQIERDCNLLEGGKCYYDGSTLNADPILEAYFKDGDTAVWAALENYYNQEFAHENKEAE